MVGQLHSCLWSCIWQYTVSAVLLSVLLESKCMLNIQLVCPAVFSAQLCWNCVHVQGGVWAFRNALNGSLVWFITAYGWKYLNLKDNSLAGFAFFSFYCFSHSATQILYIAAGKEGFLTRYMTYTVRKFVKSFIKLQIYLQNNIQSFLLRSSLTHSCLQSNKIPLNSAQKRI